MKTISIDHGFSDNKVFAGDSPLKFDTAIGIPQRTIQIEGDHPAHEYEYEGQRLVVGSEALLCKDRLYDLTIEWLIRHAPLLTAHAATLTGIRPGELTRLSVGLPLKQYRASRDLLRDRLSRFTVNGYTYAPSVRVTPQGVGALVDYIATENPGSSERGYIFDIGYNTVIILRYENRQAKSDGSSQYDRFGVSRIMEKLQVEVERTTGHRLDFNALKEMFHDGGTLFVYGKRYEFRELLKQAVSTYIDELIGKISSEFDRYFAMSRRVVCVGGGSYLIRNFVPEKYRNLFHFVDDPEYANVRGYHILAGE